MNIPASWSSVQDWMRIVASQLNPFFQRLQALPDYADDTAAAAGGVKVGELYRTSSVVKVRVS